MDKVIVIIEDEKEISDSLKFLLEKNDFRVLTYLSAEEFFSSKNRPEHCVYLVDWNLPGIKGVDIIRTIRTSDKVSPIFMMSAYNKTDQVIEGLKSGADDYITKPFNYDELLAKLSNAHSKVSSLRDNLMNVGLKLIPEAHTVIKDGVSISLTSREFVIFSYLFKKNNLPSTREELIGEFDKDTEMTSRNIDVHIFSLRKKMAKAQIQIETVWGTGYKVTL